MASHMLASGVPVPAVSARLGHSDMQTTLRIYGHMIHGQDDRYHPTWDFRSQHGYQALRHHSLVETFAESARAKGTPTRRSAINHACRRAPTKWIEVIESARIWFSNSMLARQIISSAAIGGSAILPNG